MKRKWSVLAVAAVVGLTMPVAEAQASPPPSNTYKLVIYGADVYTIAVVRLTQVAPRTVEAVVTMRYPPSSNASLVVYGGPADMCDYLLNGSPRVFPIIYRFGRLSDRKVTRLRLRGVTLKQIKRRGSGLARIGEPTWDSCAWI